MTPYRKETYIELLMFLYDDMGDGIPFNTAAGSAILTLINYIKKLEVAKE